MIRILIVDDQPLIRSAVTQLLSLESDMQVLGEATSGQEAVQKAESMSPDVILMDIRMPAGDGIWATSHIVANPSLAETKVLILTTFEEEEYVFQALRAGASGFLGKGADGTQLVAAVRAVSQGDSLLSAKATRALIEQFVSLPNELPGATPIEELEDLTEREKEILGLISQGLTNSAIAEKLFISPLTVKSHVNRLMSKLGVHDRAQLVIIAYESGLTTPGV